MTSDPRARMDPRFRSALEACEELDREERRDERDDMVVSRRKKGRSASCARSRHVGCGGNRWDAETHARTACLCPCHSEGEAV